MKISQNFRMYLRRHGFLGVLHRLADDPRLITAVFDRNEPHFYGTECEIPRRQIERFVGTLTGEDVDAIQEYHSEITNDQEFRKRIEQAFSLTVERPDTLHRNWREVLYVLTRAAEPNALVETGVYDGLSSAYMLRALQENAAGELVSIDINNTTELPTDIEEVAAGWIVPEAWRDRWRLEIGDATELLPELVKEMQVDMFLHDSLHTYDHMVAELYAVREGMNAGGIILSDNIKFNTSFQEFAADHLENVVTIKNAIGTLEIDEEPIDDRFGGGVVSA